MALRYRTLTLVLASALTVSACGDDGGTDPVDADPTVAKQSGDAQSGDIDTVLPDPIVVRFTQDGAGVAGETVTWSVLSGGGTVAPSSSTTAANGDASTTWTLGPNSGTQTLQASVDGATGSPLTFTATAVGPPPATASVSVDDNFFDPNSAEVAVGGTVTWDWVGSNTHNVTFSSGPNSATQTTGSFDRTFPDAGSFDYLCTIHGAAMSGTITVR